MSGLFDTLIAAALGQAPAIAHRPRHRFAEMESALPSESLIVEDAQAPAVLAKKPATQRTATSTALSSIAEQEHTAVTSYSDELVVPDRKESYHSFSPSSETVLMTNPSSGPAQSLLPAISSLPKIAPIASPAKSPLVPTEEAAAPLLPAYRPPPSLVKEQTDELRQEANLPVEPRWPDELQTPRFELRIGRIEVTNPRPRKAGLIQPVRPVSIARAGARQSLDDYLRGRKR